MAGTNRTVPIFISVEEDDISDSNNNNNIDLTDDDDDERQIERDLTTGEIEDYERLTRPAGHRILQSANSPICGLITPSDPNHRCVERTNGDFLFVKYILQPPRGEIYLQGVLLRRNSHVMKKIGMYHQLHAVLPVQKNELCMIIKTPENSLGCSLDDSCLVTMLLSDAVSIRELDLTNQDHPARSYVERGEYSVHVHGRHVVEEHANLVCRWKYVEEVNVAQRKATAFQLAPLDAAECDTAFGVCNAVKFKVFRGASNTGQQRYTAADLFSGAGGSVSGMVLAGLDVKYALDFDQHSCSTLRLNHDAKIDHILHKDISDFIASEPDEATGGDETHVLHVSFPCPAHSHLNRGQNPERDAVGVALTYSLKEIVQKVKPRVITLEQTNGILSKNEGQHFRPLLQALTSSGYAVRWKVMNFAEHKNPQKRKRLIIIGSCPGEILPPFPMPTYGPGKRPFTTIHDWTSDIPAYCFDGIMGRGSCERNALPYNIHAPLRECIVRSGSGAGNVHPDGNRSFCLRELACLQTFPPNYSFAGGVGAIRLQIGNAVPPVVARSIFREIVKSLRRSDAEMAAYRPEVIELDD
ncbi:hypothetical protein LTS10_011677 [Elasticomyces elasticus]|nr:hypothetical protein LTS10_011677 [Elasticomyces elasticus]